MKRYHPLLVSLHWLLAALVIGALIMGGFVLSKTPNDDPSKLLGLRMHMGIGIAILVLMLVRLVTRLRTATPPHVSTGNAALDKAGIWTHWAFYLVVIAVCASGIATARLTGLPDIVFGGSGAPLPESFEGIAPRRAHGILTKILGLLILGHIAAAIFHQHVRRDGLMARMWFGNRKG